MFPYKAFVNAALVELGFKELTPVQKEVIPKALAGRDLVVQSATGTGKTHSYLIPIFEAIDPAVHSVQTLVSAPTRELARQIYDFARQIADKSPSPIDVRLFTGGTDRAEELARLGKAQPQIVVGTPGKLRDLVKKELLLDVHLVRTFVVDEADMTLDEGFLEDVDQVAGAMGEKLQTLVFSATIPERIQPFLRKYLKNPEFIDVKSAGLASLDIRHWFVRTREKPRATLLPEILACINPFLCLVFCNTKESADEVYRLLSERKLNATLIHGGLEARKRRQIVTEIRALKYQYVVATDIVSRGIDIAGITHIVNYELPSDPEFYIHRAGRTGRMDKDGIVVSLYEFADDSYMDKLEAKGIAAEYKDMKDGVFVEAKARRERSRREYKPGQAETAARRIVKTPEKVKPGYKKKMREDIEAAKKTLRRRKGR
ncbi:MAG: DEAD/DEAH box helicase [Candidatus Izemoplasmatales bacterium]